MFGPTRTKNAIRTEAEYGLTCGLSLTIAGALNLQEWTNTEEMAGVEIAGVDNDGGNGRDGHCRSGQIRRKLQRLTMQEWTMTEEKRNRWTMTELS